MRVIQADKVAAVVVEAPVTVAVAVVVKAVDVVAAVDLAEGVVETSASEEVVAVGVVRPLIHGEDSAAATLEAVTEAVVVRRCATNDTLQYSGAELARSAAVVRDVWCVCVSVNVHVVVNVAPRAPLCSVVLLPPRHHLRNLLHHRQKCFLHTHKNPRQL